jgi:predicted amidohydrolase YtcJ
MKYLIFLVLFITLCSCNEKKQADLIVFNGTIYTVDSAFSTTEAIVIKNGKIIFTGNSIDAFKNFETKDSVNLNGKFVYPGFMDAHCHFYGFGLELNKVNLMNTTSWNDVLQKTKEFAHTHPNADWIQGRGWDQNDWTDKTYPSKKELDIMFPDKPVFLRRIDGHAGVANSKALALANITLKTNVNGGEIISINNELTGLLIDNAMTLIEKIIPLPNTSQNKNALLDAQQKCFEVGLTSIADAGLMLNVIQQIDSLQKSNQLKMRVYAMIADDSISKNYFFSHGKLKTEKLNVCSVKYYADGALGSRGACLKHGYADQKKHFGFLLQQQNYFKQQAELCNKYGFQMNVHCIGDSSNAILLQLMANELKTKNDKRWRIEHAQIMDTNDLHYFKDYTILPSIQPAFATSDMYWAEQRTGKNNFAGSYLLKSFFKYSNIIPCGSDFPIENYNPLVSIYAAVTRQDQNYKPENGFKKEEAISIQDAIKGFTIWAAFGCFEEKEKGSLEVGKFADFIIFDNDIVTTETKNIFKLQPIQTWINGEKVFEKK